MNLGPEESDPVNLFQVPRPVPSAGAAWGRLGLPNGFPFPDYGPPGPGRFLPGVGPGFGRDLFPTRLFLALDGLDRLASDSLSFSFLQVLMDESPPELRLVMCSRQAPPELQL